jgi:hypothetical protein
MNVMQVIASQPWVERLGWTLIHFLWEGLSIAFLYEMVRRGVVRTSSPQARYVVSCAALSAIDDRPAADLGTHAAGARGYRRRLSRPKWSPGRRHRHRHQPRKHVARLCPRYRFRRAAATDPVLDRDSLACRRGSVLGAAGGRMAVAARMRSMLVRRAPPEWQETLRTLGSRIGLSLALCSCWCRRWCRCRRSSAGCVR